MHADKFEQASIDEAYLDVTETCHGDWNQAEALLCIVTAIDTR